MSGLTRAAMLAEYQSVAVHGGIAAADPHRLVMMLLDGALDRIAQARGYMERGRLADKGQAISRTLALLQELRSSLDFSAGGAIANNLDALYEYCCRQLVLANADNRIELLDQVSGLLQEIRSAWAAMPQKTRPRAAAP
jgi:flagellar protein FliS